MSKPVDRREIRLMIRYLLRQEFDREATLLRRLVDRAARVLHKQLKQEPFPRWDGVSLAPPRQAAHALGCSLSSVYGHIKTGVLQTVQVGRDYRVTPDSLDWVMKNGTVKRPT